MPPMRFVTERLILRPWLATDEDGVISILGDPEVMAFSDQGALDKDMRDRWLAAAIGSLQNGTPPGTLAISSKTDDRVIGYASLSQDLGRIGRDEIELGFRLARPAWGQGYGTEVAACIVRVAHDLMQYTRLVAIVDPNNIGSVRVLQKAGLSQIGEITFDGYDYPDHLYAFELTQP